MSFWGKCNCQSKLTEADRIKAWQDGFNTAMSKSWDILLPNIDKLKDKLREEAVQEAIARLRAPNKK